MNRDQKEYVKEVLRIVECMCEDYRNRNYGDAEKWIRHINNHNNAFEENFDFPMWEVDLD